MKSHRIYTELLLFPGLCATLSGPIRSSGQRDGCRGAIREPGSVIGKDEP